MTPKKLLRIYNDVMKTNYESSDTSAKDIVKEMRVIIAAESPAAAVKALKNMPYDEDESEPHDQLVANDYSGDRKRSLRALVKLLREAVERESNA